MPRAPVLSVGIFVPARPPSAEIMPSASSRRRWRSTMVRRLGLPISSSPSKSSFTLTEGFTPSAFSASSPARIARIGALSSEAERAKTRHSPSSGARSEAMSSVFTPGRSGPSRSTGVQGGLVQRSGSTGWPS
jgi:hypothetical protein